MDVLAFRCALLALFARLGVVILQNDAPHISDPEAQRMQWRGHVEANLPVEKLLDAVAAVFLVVVEALCPADALL